LAVIAAGLHDVEATRKMGPLLQEGGSEKSRVFVVRNAVYAWNLQFSERFALGIRAWIEGNELPKEFEELHMTSEQPPPRNHRLRVNFWPQMSPNYSSEINTVLSRCIDSKVSM
jgi:hypothetical protein